MIIALPFVLACAPASGELQVVVDSTMASHVVEVLALRAPPDARGSASSVARDAPAASNAATALDDSARRLDAAFQAAREEINRDAIALRSNDRRTPAYATDYADLERRIAAAERLRSQRDAIRAEILKQRSRQSSNSTSIAAPAAPRATNRAPPAGDRDAVRRTLDRGAVTLRLESGTWWIAAADSAGVLVGRPIRHQVRAGQRDTLRLDGSG